MTRILTPEQIQTAFDVLTSSSADMGAARAMVIRTEFRAKKVHARLFRSAPPGNVEDRKAWATSQDEYEAAMMAYADAEEKWEALRDARNKAELVMEAWRTLESSERRIMRATR